MTVSIRPARPEDAALIAAMAGELSAHEGEPTPDLSAADVQRDGFGPQAAFAALLAELETAPVGYALYHGAYDSIRGRRGSFLLDLFVRDAARGRGVGRALMAAVARATRDAGGSFLWWNMLRDNTLAERFYEKLGQRYPNLLVWTAEAEDFENLLSPDS